MLLMNYLWVKASRYYINQVIKGKCVHETFSHWFQLHAGFFGNFCDDYCSSCCSLSKKQLGRKSLFYLIILGLLWEVKSGT